MNVFVYSENDLSQADKVQAQTQINQIEQQLFNETERKRLAGYAALQKQKAAALNSASNSNPN